MNYPVIWSPTAEDKYLAILKYWMDNGLNKAIKLDDALEKLVENLGQFKHLCPASERKPKFRKCTVLGGYSLIYRVKTDTIHIIDFLDNRRRPKF